MSSTLSRLRDLIGRNGKVDYDKAKQLAKDKDPAVRHELAERSDLAPELLYYLAEDTDAKVRSAVATNTSAPAQADLLLSDDKSDGVRIDLAGKIARLAPGLNAQQLDRVKRITYQAIKRLAEDQLPQVREILADTLKDVADAPPEVINRLARDTEISVAGPVLQFSPVLTDEDLLDVIRSSPVKGAVASISKRVNVDETVSSAISDTGEEDAITALLKNSSAQIREETLDMIVDKAPRVPKWHAPLTRRPHLSSKTALKLAKFVARKLVEAMLERDDIDATTAEEVTRVVSQRIDDEGAEPLPTEESDLVEHLGPEWERALNEAFEEATLRMESDAGEGLTESVVNKALSRGENPFVIGALAALAGLPVKISAKVIDSQSGKAVLGLVWKAGLSCAFSVQVQTKLAHITPEHAVKPNDDGDYPLTEEELEWQLELFTG